MSSKKQREKWDLEEVEVGLGGIPMKAVEFPRLYCEKHGIMIDLAMNMVEELTDDPNPEDFSEEGTDVDDDSDRWEYDPTELAAHVGKPTLFELRRDLRLCNRDLELKYALGTIDDALSAYLQELATTRVAQILASVRYDPLVGEGLWAAEQWERLAFAIFDEPMLSTPAQVALMKGTIWQAKRKMIHRRVLQHFMWVLIGKQGGGKTTVVTRFTAPLLDARKLNVNFEMLLDSRYISLWRYNFIMFLDEMQKASGTDRDALKAMITAPYLVRRPMRTNTDINVPHNTTFIGASNNRFTDMIKDPTGIRRFVPTRMRDRMDWDTVNELDYCELWRSVDEVNPINPASEYWDEIAELQESNRVKTPVEEWSVQIGSDEVQRMQWADWMSETETFDAFHTWETTNYPKQETTPRRYFYQEMADICAMPENGWEASNRQYRYVP